MADLPDLSIMSREEKLAFYKSNEPVKPEGDDAERLASYEETHKAWEMQVAGLEKAISEAAE